MSDEREDLNLVFDVAVAHLKNKLDLVTPIERRAIAEWAARELPALRASLAEGVQVQANQAIELERLSTALADNERWASEFKARFEQAQQQRDDAHTAARAVLPLLYGPAWGGGVSCHGCGRDASKQQNINHGPDCPVARLEAQLNNNKEE